MKIEQILPEEHAYFDAINKDDLNALKSFWKNGISVYASSLTKRDIVGYALEKDNIELLNLALSSGYNVDHAANNFGSAR